MWHGTEVFAAICHQKCLIQCFPKPAFRMLGCCHMKGSTGRGTSQYDSVHLLLPEKNKPTGYPHETPRNLPFRDITTRLPFFQPPRLSWKSLEPTYRPETDWSSFFLIHEWIYGRYIGIFTYKWMPMMNCIYIYGIHSWVVIMVRIHIIGWYPLMVHHIY